MNLSFRSCAFLLAMPISWLGRDARHILLYTFFKVGPLAITPLFAIKVVLFVVGLYFVSRLVEKLLLPRLLSRLSLGDGLKFAIGRFTMYTLIVGGLFIGVQSLGVNLNSLVVFGGAVGVGVGLGLQNVVENFVAGLILLIEQPIRMGDRVEVKETFGDVVRIGARATWVRTNDNFVIILPNSEFINNSVINWTANDPRVRLSVSVGVGYSSKPDQVRALLLEAAAGNENVLKDPAPDVLFTDFGDSSLNFQLRVWTQSKVHMPAVLKSELYFAIFKLMSDHHIELPFPQRDLHIRSSDIALPLVSPGAPNLPAS